MVKRILSLTIIFCFLLTTVSPLPKANAATVLGLPVPGTMVNLSPAYVPVLIKGLRVHQNNPLALDFIVDTGNSGLKLDRASDKQKLSKESEKLIKYFLAGLTLPEKNIWVNLSPYEKDRIIPAELGKTEMGRDMLAQDYILKQITASLIYPQKGLGKDFWDKVYREAYQRFGTTQVPVNTFNKVWIVADKATVYENNDTAFVVNSHLKVMLEEDYLSLRKHSTSDNSPLPESGPNDLHSIGSQVIRQIILPALEKEVNEGRNFANLRQIFYALILAKWYKQSLKEALLNQVYSNKNKVTGVDVNDKTITRKIYAQYLRAYKKGVFNFIKEDVDQATQEPLPRRYFSGGVLGDFAMVITHDVDEAVQVDRPTGRFVLVAENSLAETWKQPDASGSFPANLSASQYEAKAAGLFRDDFSAENWIISEPTTDFKDKMRALHSIEQKMDEENYHRTLKGIAARVFEKPSFDDTDLDQVFAGYIGFVLHGYLDKTTPGAKATRLRKIRAYLQGPDFDGTRITDQFLADYNRRLQEQPEELQNNKAMVTFNQQKLAFSASTRSNTPDVLEGVNVENLDADSQDHLRRESVSLDTLTVTQPSFAAGLDIESLKHQMSQQETELNHYTRLGRLNNIMLKHDVTFEVTSDKVELPFGYACDYTNHIVYVQPSFLAKFNRENGYYFNFFARKILAMSARPVILDEPTILETDTPEIVMQKQLLHDGQQKLLTEGARRAVEVSYIEDVILPTNTALREAYIDLFKDNATPEDIRKKLAENVLFRSMPTKAEEARIKMEFINGPVETASFQLPSKATVEMNQEIYRIGVAAANIMGVNAMDGISEYRSRGVVKSEEMVDGEMREVLKMFSNSSNKRKTKLQAAISKFNPPTWAQDITLVYLPFVLSGADVLIVSPSEFSNVKREIDKTFPERKALLTAEMRGLFGDLPFVLTGDVFLSQDKKLGLPFINSDNMRYWNGEEVVYMLCQQFKDQLQSVTYAAGGDYNFVAQAKGSVSIFDDMNKPNVNPHALPDLIDYYLFWYMVNPKVYKALLNLQNEGITNSPYKRPFDMSGPKNKSVFDTLLNGAVKPEWYSDLNKLHRFFNPQDFPVMPRFLVPAKLMMIQDKFPSIKIYYAMALRQGEAIGDDVIPYLVEHGLSIPGQTPLKLSKMNIPGLLLPVSATIIRNNGLKPLLQGNKVVNADGLAAMSRNVANIFRDHPEYIDKILRLDDGYMLPLPDKISPEAMKRDLGAMLDRVGLHDKIAVMAKTTHINVGGGDVEFSVQQQYKSNGDKLNIVIFQRWRIGSPEKRKILKDVLMQYLLENTPQDTITQIKNEKEFLEKDEQDRAMATDGQVVAPVVLHHQAMPGGIDFNTNQMQLDVQKQGAGVTFNFDPALIKRFETGDFRGFMPVIINMRPIADIAPMLGLNEEQTELSKV